MDRLTEPQKPGTVRVPTNSFSEDQREQMSNTLIGCAAHYQLGFTGSPVTQLMNGVLRIGDVEIRQSLEPFQYQHTDVFTTDHDIPYEGEMTRRVWSRQGQIVTVATTEFTVSENETDRDLAAARALCEAALGAVAAVLDERFLDRRLGELVEVQTPHGRAYLDLTHAVRSFDPDIKRVALNDLEGRGSTFAGNPVLQTALKLYMRAVENRVSEVGFILLASAADMLAGGKFKFKAFDLLAAMKTAGASESWTMNRMKKVVSTRGQLIHRGLVPTAEMYESWYELEEVVRTLLRHKMHVRSDWSARVPMYEGPIRAFDTAIDEEPYPEWAMADGDESSR